MTRALELTSPRRPPNSEAVPLAVEMDGPRRWSIGPHLAVVSHARKKIVEIVGDVRALTEDEARCLATALRLAVRRLEIDRGEG